LLPHSTHLGFLPIHRLLLATQAACGHLSHSYLSPISKLSVPFLGLTAKTSNLIKRSHPWYFGTLCMYWHINEPPREFNKGQ
jgi:hypothetical protein